MSERSEKEHSLVSVIIPSFKMGQFIGEALDSVGAQTYPHWEVIVVDDAGPEDGTRAAVEAFAAKYTGHRVEYIQHDTNQGVSVARRTAFEVARGEYIAFLDADDVFIPEKLAKQAAILEQESDVVLVHGPVMEGGEWGASSVGSEIFDLGSVDLSYNLWDSAECLVGNRICNSTVVCRRTCIRSSDFPLGMVFQYEDWMLWLLMGSRGRFKYAQTRTARYRYHFESYSAGSQRREGQHEMAQVEMLLALFSRLESRIMRHAVTDRLVLLLAETMAAKEPMLPRPVSAAPGFRWSVARASASQELRRLGRRLRQIAGL